MTFLDVLEQARPTNRQLVLTSHRSRQLDSELATTLSDRDVTYRCDIRPRLLAVHLRDEVRDLLSHDDRDER